ncbi:MAG: ComF family protein [Labilithrix sp.]|nr:ComF family protein [Labilithrix sp.]
MSFVRLGLDLLGELVSPTRCAACDERVGARVVFCGSCALSVSRAGPARRLTAGGALAGEHAVLAYGGAVATAIMQLKYFGRSDLLPRFGAVMAVAAREITEGVDVVVSVPLHPVRLAARGFDQAALLAGPVARQLRVKHEVGALERVRDTPKQATHGREARAANVAGAFRCAGERIAGRRVLLVDDVRTTGATLSACAVALRGGGARRVVSLVLASRDLEG